MEDDATQFLVDTLRVLTIAGALLVILAIGRLAWLRRDAPPEVRHRLPHFATMLSYGVLLVVVVVRRGQGLGQPLDWLSVVTAASVALGLLGIFRRLRIHPPGHRPSRRRKLTRKT